MSGVANSSDGPSPSSTWETALSNGDSLSIDGCYEQAIDEYGIALTLLPANTASGSSLQFKFRILSHRAKAFLAYGRYDEALHDTQKAMQLLSFDKSNTDDPTSPLMQLRSGETELCLQCQGRALVALGRDDEAQITIDKAISIAELNQQSSQFIEFLKQMQLPESASSAKDLRSHIHRLNEEIATKTSTINDLDVVIHRQRQTMMQLTEDFNQLRAHLHRFHRDQIQSARRTIASQQDEILNNSRALALHASLLRQNS